MNSSQARARIEAGSDLNAFIALSDEEGDGPVVGVKDLIDVRGMVTTGGGTILDSVAKSEDAPVVARVRAAGQVIIGKTNLHEWAYGLTSQNPHYGPVRNPHDHERVAGGSSGGSAAAVAAGMCDWALGTDTGGSIRVPAAYCGVVGLKPSVGLVETDGVIALSRTLDTVGPLAPDVTSAARALEVMAGLDSLLPPQMRPLERLRIGAVRSWAAELVPEIKSAWDFASEGLEEVDFPTPQWMSAPATIILQVEASAQHRRWIERHRSAYGPDVLALLEAGAKISRREYSRALFEQSGVRQETEARLQDWDAVLVPATRIMPPKIGAPYERVDISGFTRPFNCSGHPAICLPIPVRGLPVGVQLVGHYGDEAGLIEAALALESHWRAARQEVSG